MPLFQGYIAYAPFPEGFKGDMDETFQQAGQLATIFISGNFLTGLYYPSGTTPPALPTSDQGPVALNGVWYFWDPVTGQYLPQTTSVKPAVNYCKNAIYQVQQGGNAFSLSSAGANKTFDMVLSRVSQPNILAVAADIGPPASADTDNCSTAIKYTVGPSVMGGVLGITDLFAHEHLIEGSDIAMAQGEHLSLAFSVWINQAGTYSAYLTSSGRDASYVFSFNVATASQWARIKINNIPAFPTGIGTWNFTEGQTGLYLGVVLGTGSQYQTSTPNQWLSGFFAGTSANTNLLTVLGNQMKIAAIKLEASTSATFCAVKSFEADLHDCIRYYWTSFNYQSLTAGTPLVFQSTGTNIAYGSLVFPRRMCKAPTVVPYSWNSHAAGNMYNLGTPADVAVATLPAVPKGLAGSITVSSTKGDTLACLVTADARLS